TTAASPATRPANAPRGSPAGRPWPPAPGGCTPTTAPSTPSAAPSPGTRNPGRTPPNRPCAAPRRGPPTPPWRDPCRGSAPPATGASATPSPASRPRESRGACDTSRTGPAEFRRPLRQVRGSQRVPELVGGLVHLRRVRVAIDVGQVEPAHVLRREDV